MSDSTRAIPLALPGELRFIGLYKITYDSTVSVGTGCGWRRFL